MFNFSNDYCIQFINPTSKEIMNLNCKGEICSHTFCCFYFNNITFNCH
ncbi:hypothetical protein vBEcoMWL3_gp202 [Escherichia phage vB_EcoM_WL-3]|nr:hypothetical protein vBEcoMWL3_gp202 [Escherichia phage vB_EcoM_WL-3]